MVCVIIVDGRHGWSFGIEEECLGSCNVIEDRRQRSYLASKFAMNLELVLIYFSGLWSSTQGLLESFIGTCCGNACLHTMPYTIRPLASRADTTFPEFPLKMSTEPWYHLPAAAVPP